MLIEMSGLFARGRMRANRLAVLGRCIGLLSCLVAATAALAQPAPDLISDRVGATAGQFRVDESGAATYSIPIYAPPGTAGVVPQLALSYSSQAGNGIAGRGWNLSGISSVSRCRASRESGDFIVNGQPVDGDPNPVNFTSSDKFCLDGQRLIPAPVAAAPCKALSGASVQQFRSEIESFQRVCAYTFTPANGPRFFTVERKDGSISWYGDRDTTSGTGVGPRSDGIVLSNIRDSAGNWSDTAVVASWSQTRFQDSTGNYIDYRYTVNPSGVSASGEAVLAQVNYTGKVVLAGQTGSAKSPYAHIAFGYEAAAQTIGYQSGSRFYSSQRLNAITVSNGANVVRYYAPTYATSLSGTGAVIMTQITECADASKTICYPPTTFDWSVARNEFAAPVNTPTPDHTGWDGPSGNGFLGMKFGDVNGDGRTDVVYFYKISTSGDVVGVAVAYGTGSGYAFSYTQRVVPNPYFSPSNGDVPGNDGWFLTDYNGDGRDDLVISVGSAVYGMYSVSTYPAAGSGDFGTAGADLFTPPLPSEQNRDKQAKLADLNGDGLHDVVYYTSGGIRARLMEKSGSSYAWGAERLVAPDICAGVTSCSYVVQGLYRKKGYQQLTDFNGDARSDLLLYLNVTAPCNSAVLIDGGDLLTVNPTSNGTSCSKDMIVALTVDTITSATVSLKKYAWWLKGTLADDPFFWFVDINGDGLADFVHSNSGVIDYRWNTGAGFTVSKVLSGAILNNKKLYVQLADVNGDGRADIVYPNSTWANFVVRYATSTGDFTAETTLVGAATDTSSEAGYQNHVYSFGDFDSDGAVDYLVLKVSGTGLYTSLSRAGTVSRFQPRDTLMRITNGYGALTQLVYLPLNDKEVHDRYSNMRNWAFFGRGSPVQELVSATYLVAMVRNSAPTAADPLAQSTHYYHYTGAAVQAGGRGFLGFTAITDIDANHGNKYVTTTTRYRQDFPFVGRPSPTETRVVDGAYSPGACFDPSVSGCLMLPYYQPPAMPGILAEIDYVYWGLMPGDVAFAPGVQSPQQVQVSTTGDYRYDPGTGAFVSFIWSMFQYNANGGVTFTRTSKYAGSTEDSLLSSVDTNNTSYADDEANWRLGRLAASTVVFHRQNGPDIARSTSYDYDLAGGGAKTGLLTREQTQPGGSTDMDLRTEYQLDEYGNRVAAFTCSKNIVNCKDTTQVVQAMDSATTVHRYTRQEFDADGRYPLRSIETFRAVGSTWNSGQRAETITQEVLARDNFGVPTQVRGLNGLMSAAATGTMGRDYWAWTQTREGAVTVGNALDGVATTKTYRFCGTGTNQVACPTGAAIRERVSADGAPTRWTYLDVLARPMLVVAESLKAGVTGKDFTASCTWYDSTGKVYGVSEPFFLTSAAVSGEPAFGTQPCSLASRDVTYQLYDPLGRPTQVIQPDGTTTATTYNGLTTTTTVTAANVTPQMRTETRNVAGELLNVSDQAGAVTRYAYDSAGDLATVTRNAGRGDIVTSMTYDTLGRKTSLVDPDAGTRTYTYTPAGEVATESDGQMRIQKLYDFRGRLVNEISSLPGGNPSDQVSKVFMYDLATNGLGQLQTSAVAGSYPLWVADSSKALNYTENRFYDTLGRLSTTTTNIDGVDYISSSIYDRYGRAYKNQDPTGAWAKSEYTARGYAVRVCESSAGDASATCVSGDPNTYLETIDIDARGKVLEDMRGGTVAMVTDRTYDPFTGRMTNLCVGGPGCAIARQSMGWDGIGNLQFRDTEKYREEFTYDGLNRLLEGRLARVGTQNFTGTSRPITTTLSYDLLGNICSKTINGSVHQYTYSGRAGCGLGGAQGAVNGDMVGSPDQVRAIAGSQLNVSYQYDARGNQTVGDYSATTNDRGIAYTYDDRAYQIAEGTKGTRFWYGPGGERYKREDYTAPAGATLRKTISVANLEIVTENSVITTKRYVAGVLLQVRVGSTITNKYLHTDNLGSVVAITDASGVLLERMDFGPFGERRNATDPRNLGTAVTTTTKGFTGQEMVDGLDIVHMNGRIYDDRAGRFLQADPFVQEPNNPQNFNRYTYVWNNPLAYTDPTGYLSIGQQLRQFAGALIAAYLPGSTAIFGNMANTAFASTISGFVGGVVASGNVKGGLIGAFGSGVTASVQNSWDESYQDDGLVTEQTGGKFVSGSETETQRNSDENAQRSSQQAPVDVPTDLSKVPTDHLKQLMQSAAATDRVDAARAAINYFHIKGEGYSLTFDGKMAESASVGPDGDVKLGPGAYKSWSMLGSTLGHEIEIHWEVQFKNWGPYSNSQDDWLREVQAFRYNIKSAVRFGSSAAEVKFYQYWENRYYSGLRQPYKGLADVGIYHDWNE